MWNLDIWMQKPRACSLPFLKCTAWAFEPRLPRRKTLYHLVSILSFFINWQRIMVCTFLICDADSVCFSHDHFHCQLRTCMFWSQTCNEKVDGLEIRQGMSCSGCLGPLCEEINHLSVANRIASHIYAYLMKRSILYIHVHFFVHPTGVQNILQSEEAIRDYVRIVLFLLLHLPHKAQGLVIWKHVFFQTACAATDNSSSWTAPPWFMASECNGCLHMVATLDPDMHHSSSFGWCEILGALAWYRLVSWGLTLEVGG